MLSERERLEKAIDSVVGMIVFDNAGTLVASNQVFRQITGFTSEDIESGKLSWRNLTPPEWVPESQRQWERCHTTGRAGPYEKEYFLKDGSRRWMLFNARKLDEETVLECCVDVTERRKAEVAAQRSEQQRKELIADLAHSLNNPLQIAISALHLVKDELQGNAAARQLEDALQRIHAVTERLTDVTEATPTGSTLDVARRSDTKTR